MQTGEWLTISDISKQLGLEESTIRFYRNKFEKYIPFVGQGSSRRYYAASVEIFRFINQAFKKDLNVLEIEEALNKSSRKESQKDILEQQKSLLASVSAVFEQVQMIMEEMADVIDELNRYRLSFEKKEQDLTARIERLEQKARLPFWKRWLGLS
ncbi:MerR family transcriptional regulator [Aneurinibacillus terranovensis]|uniref:MerR family transcriptional regulator n=1 Tax=Aneurinibacillus terranovensis TaxID=278991 RepID=UPI0003FB73FE|nr:MerR family transcriptional regulator [Aneurinibacillus terranovensis]